MTKKEIEDNLIKTAEILEFLTKTVADLQKCNTAFAAKLEKKMTETTTETKTKKEQKKPMQLLRFAFNNWELRKLMKVKRVKWNAAGKGWEINGKVTRDELGSNDYEIVEF